MPPQRGIAPRIRIGRRWINTLWGFPIGAAALLCVIAVAQSVRELPGRDGFHPAPSRHCAVRTVGRRRLPLVARAPAFSQYVLHAVHHAGWLANSGRPSEALLGAELRTGTDWFRFQVPVPKRRIWTAKDDWVTLPTWLGIPGSRHTLGLSRWWHFSANLLWVVNGVGFYVLLFSTDQWRRLVPQTWDVFPAALSTAIQYASLNFPVDEGWTRYNGLQQLSYFIMFLSPRRSRSPLA
jgi:sulfoxide reductase catalytic subunit YedY